MSDVSASVPAPVLPRPSNSPAPRADALPQKLYGVDVRFIAPILITCILLVAQLSKGMLESYPKTLLAIGASIITEMVLGKIFTGKIPHLASAYVSGISVGILVRSPEFWPYALCAMISITSKYVFRVNGRHIWNPSNFGIAAMLFLASDTVASLSVQWGNNLIPLLVIWGVGSFIVWRLNRFHITATYVISFVLFAFLRSGITHHTFLAEVSPITGSMYQLFIFFMITDPKTTVHGRKAQMLVAFLVAGAEMVLRLSQNVHAPYYALFLVGPIANLVDIKWMERKKRLVPIGAVA